MKPITTGTLRRHATILLLCTALFVLSSFPSEVCAGTVPPADNQLYAGYMFRKTPKTITLATQPLATPIGVITEVIKRDRILGKALAAQGSELNILSFLNGPDINHFFKQGELDIALSGDMPTTMLAATTDIIIAGLVKLGPCSMVTNKKYNRITELRGKRIGVPEGTSAHFGLLVALESTNMQERDIETVFMNVNELENALAKGSIDAFAAFQPTPEQAVAENPNLAIIHQFLNFSYIFLRREFLWKKIQKPPICFLLLICGACAG